jgi:hypothetical protein
MQRAGNPVRASVHGPKTMGAALSNAPASAANRLLLKKTILATHGVKAFE